MALVLEVVAESLDGRDPVFPEYAQDARFNPNWWHSGSARSPAIYYRLQDEGEEVARVKIKPNSRAYGGYTTWAPPTAGATEIELLEVRVDLRLSDEHYGRQAVCLVEATYGRPVIALSLDTTSDGFWRSLGWTPHVHPKGERYRTLFASP